MEIMQGISSLDHLPMDITLRLSDGNIKANKMMLGIVSPVFMKMLYGSFKEASSSEVDPPKDNYKIMKLLFDIVFEGSSELESLDDIIPLMEVVDRYEIKDVQCSACVMKPYWLNLIPPTLSPSYNNLSV